MGVRQLAEQVLQLLQPLHERASIRETRCDRLQEIAQALGRDARGVQLGRLGRRQDRAEPSLEIVRVVHQGCGGDCAERHVMRASVRLQRAETAPQFALQLFEPLLQFVLRCRHRSAPASAQPPAQRAQCSPFG